MPNRASLMTCRMPTSHGVTMNGIPLAQRNVTFVELMRDAGYRTALVGKSHLQTFTGIAPTTERPPARPGYHRPEGELAEAVRHDLDAPVYKVEEPDFWAGPQPRVPTPFYGFDHVKLVTGHGDDVGGDYVAWLLEREPDAARLIGRENQLPHDYVCRRPCGPPCRPSSTRPPTSPSGRPHSSRQHAGDDRPFFLVVSWPDPHHPFNPPSRYWDMYEPSDMPVPEAFRRPDWTPPPHVAGVHHAREVGEARLRGMNAIGCTAREAQEAQALTCGMVTMIDDAVGRVRAALDASGRAGETVEIFTTDHGDHLGDHRLLFKGAEQYEQITRVPFLWADPDGEAGVRSDRIGQTHDIGTTILERARIEPAYGMQGLDLLGGPRERRPSSSTPTRRRWRGSACHRTSTRSATRASGCRSPRAWIGASSTIWRKTPASSTTSGTSRSAGRKGAHDGAARASRDRPRGPLAHADGTGVMAGIRTSGRTEASAVARAFLNSLATGHEAVGRGCRYASPEQATS